MRNEPAPLEAGVATLQVNGRSRPLGDCRRLGDLLGQLGYEVGTPGVAVAHNGEVVPRSEWAGRRLCPGDEIEIVGAAQGG